MSDALLAEFDTADTLIDAAKQASARGFHVVDAFTPFSIPQLGEMIEQRPSRIRVAMLIAGLGMAAFAFALQWYSSVINYPINSGGRPLNSWPVFLLVPFEVGVFAAALAGIVTLMWECGLPRLNHPTFDVIGFERVTQDRFFLLARGNDETAPNDLRATLSDLGARTVSEVRP